MTGNDEGYMCLTDFDCELGMAKGGVSVYASIEDLRENEPCADECGIVKVRVIKIAIVQPMTLPE